MNKKLKTQIITLIVGPNLLRGTVDGSEGKTTLADRSTWRAAQELLERWTYNSDAHGGEVRADLRPLVKMAEQSVAYELASERKRKFMDTKFIFKSVELRCRVSHTGKSSAEELAARYFYDFFLMMNLASPGSCSFWKARIKGCSPSDALSLSNHSFEWAWTCSIDRGWNTVDAIDLSTVVDWYKALGIGLRQRAEARIERALFCLLHIAKSEQLHPDGLVWLAHGLEALFETSSERSQNSLISRCSKLLVPPERKEKELRERLRSFYSLRSSFVHGGFPIIHPRTNELHDPSIDPEIKRIMAAMDDGASFLVGSIQKLIRNGWKELRYSETWSPVAVSNSVEPIIRDGAQSRANHSLDRPADR